MTESAFWERKGMPTSRGHSNSFLAENQQVILPRVCSWSLHDPSKKFGRYPKKKGVASCLNGLRKSRFLMIVYFRDLPNEVRKETTHLRVELINLLVGSIETATLRAPGFPKMGEIHKRLARF